MLKILHYEDIDRNLIHGSFIFIDVRSPHEYSLETIPGAINIPIFDNEERKEIGTVYNHESVEKAKQIGMEYASKKLPIIFEQISQLDKEYNNLVFFCERGGFRSSSLASLFNSVGINAMKLDGGYKGYRKYIYDQLPPLVEEVNFIVLYGNTGSGKTDILKEMASRGIDVLDLEGLANHRGSLLGGVGLGEQRTQKMFESLLFETLRNRKSDTIFVEGESKRIGKIALPEYLFTAIRSGINIKINADMEFRIDNILRDYVHDNDNELISGLNLLRKNIGNKIIDKEIELILKHNYRKVIEELMVKYYDPLYEHNVKEYIWEFKNENSGKLAEEIVETIHSSQCTIHNC